MSPGRFSERRNGGLPHGRTAAAGAVLDNESSLPVTGDFMSRGSKGKN
jgi:hypothetical protein